MSFPNFVIQFLGNAIGSTLPAVQKTVNDIVRIVNDMQKNLNQIFQQLLSKVQLDNVILPPVTLKVGQNVIQHTLGRVLTGWQPINVQTASPKLVSYQVADNQYFYLTSDVVCTVTFLVF